MSAARRAILAMFAVSSMTCAAESGPPSNDMPEVVRPEIADAVERAVHRPHPRLFADAEGFARLKARVESDELLKIAAGHVRHNADGILATTPSERVMDGRRLLGVSRTALYRISTLAMAYRMYGDKAYLDRAVAELRAVCAFTDWNPSHFLDVGEMSLAVAVGYDWLFKDLGESVRREIAGGLRRNGLDASLEKRWWIRQRNNWGQVCHAGILSAALALAEDNPAETGRFVQRAVDDLPLSMNAYAPNGNCPEGPGYWSYGIHYNVIAIALLDSSLGSDFGLATLPGFRDAGLYPDLVTGPSGEMFNYADGSSARGSYPALWWYAKRLCMSDALLYREIGLFKKHVTRSGEGMKNPHGIDRLFPFVLFWLDAPLPSGEPSRLPLVWHGQGGVPIAVQRSGWNDEDALFVGLKGGSPSGPHGHMDAGSFVMDTKGVRWAVDLGPENYNWIESRGMNLWSFEQDSDRWKIYRLNTWSHNVPMLDGCQQNVKGNARFLNVRREFPSEVAIDLSSLYTNATEVLRRGVMSTDGRKYELSDIVRGFRPGGEVRWSMVTRAEVQTDGSSVVLRQGGQTLRLVQTGRDTGPWRIAQAAGPNVWDSPNEGFLQLTFTVNADASGEASLAVAFMRDVAVDISVGRQLFVDDFLVDETTNVVRHWNKPVKMKDPVLWPGDGAAPRSVDNIELVEAGDGVDVSVKSDDAPIRQVKVVDERGGTVFDSGIIDGGKTWSRRLPVESALRLKVYAVDASGNVATSERDDVTRKK